jgi:hypothetical protein
MITRLLFSILCASCAVTPEPYEVIATADLVPGTLGITGQLEILGTGDPKPDPATYHMVAAYRVRLPDSTPRRLRLFTPASCDTPHDDVVPSWNLGQIRRVGVETHFFATEVAIGDRTIDVDVVTRYVFVDTGPDTPLFHVFNMIAVVQDLQNDDDDQYGPGRRHQGSGPGDWLACGVFTRR